MSIALTDSQVTYLARHLADNIETIAKSILENPERLKGYREWHLRKFGCEPEEVRNEQ